MKTNTRLRTLFTAGIALGCLVAYAPTADATYEYEGVEFHAPTRPGSYTPEGTAFYAYPDDSVEETVPVYRFYDPVSGDHFYTPSETEKTNLEGNPDTSYRYEGIAFYAYPDDAFDGTIPVYRFYNSNSGDHFYTRSEAEKATLIANPGWSYRYEGVGWYGFPDETTDGTVPVYRFYNPNSGDHFYTANETERSNLSLAAVYRFYNPNSGDHFYTPSRAEKSIVENTAVSGYRYEGIALYGYLGEKDGTTPVYRFYNSVTGDHFYTADEAEKDGLVDNPDSSYRYEGISFHAYADETDGTSPVYRFYNSATGDHFYTANETEKTRLATSGIGPEISVGLWNYTRSGIQESPFKIEANKAYNIKDRNGDIIATVDGEETTRVTYDSDSYLLVYGYDDLDSETLSRYQVSFDAADGDDSTLIFDVHRPDSSYDRYRGKMKVQYYDRDNVWVVNTLPLEHYVWGMGETTGTGDIEHTKVMTTMFRTYGYWYIKYATRYNPYGFTIRSDSGSQIYYGYDWEIAHPNIRTAAGATRGVIAVYDGDVALTPYSSWSDGRTRSFEERWGSDDYPWCRSVPDPYGEHPTLSTEELEAAGNHMVGLIANGSVVLAADHDWTYRQIMTYYYTGITLGAAY